MFAFGHAHSYRQRDASQSVGDVDLRYGGIGGLTEAIGLTDVQREENPDDKKFSILIKVVRRWAVVAANHCSVETRRQTLLRNMCQVVLSFTASILNRTPMSAESCHSGVQYGMIRVPVLVAHPFSCPSKLHPSCCVQAVAVLALDFAVFAWEYISALQAGTAPPLAPR